MCPVQKMQKFAIDHHIVNPSVLPELLSTLANRQNLPLETYLERLENKPDLSDFVAEMANFYPNSR